MVVRLDLHQHVRQFRRRAVAAVVARIEARDRGALHHRRVVRIRDDRARRMRAVRLADHREQALVLRHAVDDPVGVEDLVPAVLGVRLREHHELDVGRIAAQAAEARVEVVDFVGRQREAQFGVRCSSARAPRASSGIVVSGCGGKCANSRAASARSSNTASSSGRASAAAARRDRLATSGAPSRVVTRYSDAALDARDRARPQLRAMSVAFDDHGEMVPGRGTTSS